MMIIKNVRISFPELFEARAYEDQEPKFSCTFLIPEGSELDKTIQAEIQRVAQNKWGAKAAATLKSITGNNMKYCYRPAGEKDYQGYEGINFFKASNTTRPTVIGRDRAPLTKADGKPYSGCYVNASVEFYAHSKGGIACSLKGVQFCADGDAFTGGGIASPDDFDDLACDDVAHDFA